MKRLRLAVVGVGHLGKEHARILSTLPDVELVGVADVNFEQAQNVARRVGTQAYSDYWPLLNLVDAASIVAPTSLHASIGRDFLRRGIHLLIEKPIAPTLAEADELVDLAQSNGAILQVGHIERFNPAFEDLQTRSLRPRLIRAQRMGPFTGRSTDIGVTFDLMIHDIDLLHALVGAPVQTVTATGLSVFGRHEDVVSARLQFEDGCVAEVTASRASPSPSRQMQIWGAEGYADVDFAARRLTLVQPSEQVRQHGLDPSRLDPASRSRFREDLFGRHLEMRVIEGKTQDQLTCELEHFVTCIRTGSAPRVSGSDARAAVALAEQVVRCVRNGSATQVAPTGLLFPRSSGQEVA